MIKKISTFIGLTLILVCISLAETNFEDFNLELYIESGQIVNGVGNGGTDTLDFFYLNRLGGLFSLEKDVNDKLELKFGVGIYLFRPHLVDRTLFHTGAIYPTPWIGDTYFKYKFSDYLQLKGGFVSIKYNENARNLGEYLFRSEAYPTMIRTGGRHWINSAYVRTAGLSLELNLFGGSLNQQVLFLVERETLPFFDITPAYIIKWKPIKGIELGGGVALHRGISFDIDSYYEEKSEKKSYVAIQNFPEVQNRVRYKYEGVSYDVFWRPGENMPDPALFIKENYFKADSVNIDVQNLTDPIWVQMGREAGLIEGSLSDLKELQYCRGTGSGKICDEYYTSNSENLDSILFFKNSPNSSVVADSKVSPVIINQGEYSFKATKIMGNFSIDWIKLLNLPDNWGDFRSYGEAVLLGYKNYPVLYDNKRNRLPIMVGAYLPTFGLLDGFQFEFEYLNNPFSESVDLAYEGLPLPVKGSSLEKGFVPPSEYQDDWKWSVLLQKNISEGFTIFFQAANDHTRLKSWNGSQESFALPVTHDKDHWYYMFRMQWGL